MRAIVVVMRMASVVMLMASVASAQPADPPPSQPAADAPETAPTPAMIAFHEGRTLLEAGKYEEACARFNASIKDDPDAPGTLLNLGLCNEKLGKIATALAWYRKAQFRAAETQVTEYEQAAKQQTVVLAAKVPKLRIDAAAGAKVLLDGNELSELDRVSRLEVDPGTHVIESGNDRRTVIMREGEELTVDMRPSPVRLFVVVDHGVKQRRLAYLAGGVGGALLVTSLAVTLVGKSKYDATDHLDVNQHWQNVVRYGGTSLFLLGTAAIGAGAYLYIKAPGKEHVEQIAPVVGPNQVGVAVAGSF